MEAYGVESKELELINQYLQGRKQSVFIDGVQSEAKQVTHGVPQGSVLGPLLFIIFINDLPWTVKESVVDIYADDTTLSTSAPISTPDVVQQKLQDDMNRVLEWPNENWMILNASKTKALLVTGKRLKSKLLNVEFTVTTSGEEVEQVSSQKLLGVRIDKELNYNEHIDNLCRKVSQSIGVLNKIKRNLPIRE